MKIMAEKPAISGMSGWRGENMASAENKSERNGHQQAKMKARRNA
jgi:hypothetical protein